MSRRKSGAADSVTAVVFRAGRKVAGEKGGKAANAVTATAPASTAPAST